MISIRASSTHQLVAAVLALRAAGVEVTATGGNDLVVPDDTNVSVLRTVAATGAVVHADLTDVDEPDAAAANDAPDKPVRKPRKTTTRRTKE